MKRGYDIGGRYSQDPIGSQGEKSLSQRKSSRDFGLTPTEKFQKNQLMKQFCRLESGVEDVEAYRNAPCWCGCERGLRGESGLCAKCEAEAVQNYLDEDPALRGRVSPWR